MTYVDMAGLYACHAGQDQHACAPTISVISAAGWPTRFPDRCAGAPKAEEEAASPPLISGRAAQATGRPSGLKGAAHRAGARQPPVVAGARKALEPGGDR